MTFSLRTIDCVECSEPMFPREVVWSDDSPYADAFCRTCYAADNQTEIAIMISQANDERTPMDWDADFTRTMLISTMASGQYCLDNFDAWIEDPSKGKDYVLGWLQGTVRDIIAHSPELADRLAEARASIDAQLAKMGAE